MDSEPISAQPQQLPTGSNARPDDIAVDIVRALFASEGPVSSLTESQRLLVSLFTHKSNGAFWIVMDKLEAGTVTALRACCRYTRSNVVLSSVSTLRMPLAAASELQLTSTSEMGNIYPSAKRLDIVFPQATKSTAEPNEQQGYRNALAAQLRCLQKTSPKLLQQLRSIHFENTTSMDYNQDGCVPSLLTSCTTHPAKLSHLHLSFSGSNSTIDLEEDSPGLGLTHLSQLTCLQSGLLGASGSPSLPPPPTSLPQVFSQLISFTTGDSGLPLLSLLQPTTRLQSLDLRSIAPLDILPRLNAESSLASLTHLSLRIPRNQRISQPTFVVQWLTHLSNLQHLSLNTRCDSLGEILQAACHDLPTSLVSLTLTNIHPEDTLCLSSLTSLTSLSLHLNSSAPTRLSFDFLPSLTQLRTFCLRSTSTPLTPSLLTLLSTLPKLSAAILPLQPICRWAPLSSPFSLPTLSSLIFLLPKASDGEHPMYELPRISSPALESLALFPAQPSGSENPLLEPFSVLSLLEACPRLRGFSHNPACPLIKQVSKTLQMASPLLILDPETLLQFSDKIPDSLNYLELCIPDDTTLPNNESTPSSAPAPPADIPPSSASDANQPPPQPSLEEEFSTSADTSASDFDALGTIFISDSWSILPAAPMSQPACSTLLLDSFDDDICGSPPNPPPIMSHSAPAAPTDAADASSPQMFIYLPTTRTLVLDEKLSSLPVFHKPNPPPGFLESAAPSHTPPVLPTITQIAPRVFPPLTSLLLGNSPPFSPATLAALPPSLPNISTLHLPNITDGALLSLCCYCPDLSELAIEDASSLCDRPLQHLAITHATTLMTLRLYFAEQVTHKATDALAGMQQLKQLYLHGAPKVDAEAVRKLVAAPSIGLLGLKDVGVESLAKLLGSWGVAEEEMDRAVRSLSSWVVIQQ